MPAPIQSTDLSYTPPPSTTTYPGEWVYPNDSFGRYVTGTQCQIYVGNLFIDEIDSIQVMYYANSVPYYGYASTRADAFGRGRDIVQGQFAINFVSQGYMYTVLNEFKLGTSQSTPATVVQNVANLYVQLQQAMATSQSGTNNPGTSNQYQQLRTQIAQASQGLTPDQIDQVSALVGQMTGSLTSETSLTTSVNAINYKIPFNIIMKSTAGGRTITRTINDCVLISNEQQIDQSGQVLLDVYGFIARSFV
jgi:hypothetical protein